MAGHSHWANIARKKARVDNKRGKLFATLSRAINMAAQHGGADPDANLTLRYAIDKARRNSMPMDNIERAIKKGCGETSGEKFDELLYEGYGPEGVAVLCEILTENRNRTASEVCKLFEAHGGNPGATGCVAWMSDRRAVFIVDSNATDEESLFDVALQAGADAIAQNGQQFEITTEPENLQTITAALSAAGNAADSPPSRRRSLACLKTPSIWVQRKAAGFSNRWRRSKTMMISRTSPPTLACHTM
jgi:YebC/PmpR family DNA-binding regulatory protein